MMFLVAPHIVEIYSKMFPTLVKSRDLPRFSNSFSFILSSAAGQMILFPTVSSGGYRWRLNDKISPQISITIFQNPNIFLLKFSEIRCSDYTLMFLLNQFSRFYYHYQDVSVAVFFCLLYVWIFKIWFVTLL